MNTRRSLIEPLETRIALATDISIDITGSKMPDRVVPGDTISLDLLISESGDPNPSKFGVHVYLSTNNVFGDGDDVLVDKVRNVDVGAAGFSKRSVKFDIPALSLPNPVMPEGTNFIIVQADPSDVVTGEPDEGNNFASLSFDLAFEFGNVGSRTNVPLPIEGGPTFNLQGAGTGSIVIGSALLPTVLLTGTDEKSTMSVTGDDSVLVESVAAISRIGAVKAPQLDVRGDLDFLLGVNSLELGKVGSRGGNADAKLSIGNGPKPSILKFVSVEDLDIDARAGIALLQTGEWHDDNGQSDLIDAPYLVLLKAKSSDKTGTTGNFDASLTLGPATLATKKLTGVLGVVDIDGSVRDALWTIDADGGLALNKLLIEGNAQDFRFHTDGSVNKFEIDGDWTGLANGDGKGTFLAKTLKTMIVRGDFAGTDFVLTGSEAKTDIGLGKAVFFGINRFDEIRVENGGIEILAVGRFEDGHAHPEITAEWIKKVGFVTYTGDLTVTGKIPGGKAEVSIKEMFVKEDVAGQWRVAHDIASLDVGTSADSWQLNPLTPGGDVVLGKFLGDRDVDGTINVKVEDVQIRGTFFGTLADARSVLSYFSADGIDGATINATSIGTLSGGALFANSVVNALTLDKVKVRGDMTNVIFNLGQTGASLGSLSVTGTASAVQIIGAANSVVGSITAGVWNGGSIDIGSLLGAFKTTAPDGAGTIAGLTLVTRDTSGTSFGSLDAGGGVFGSTFTIGGSARSVTAHGFSNGSFTAAGAIRSFTVEKSGVGGGILVFNVTAATLDSIVLRDAEDENPSAWGVSVSGAIAKYIRYEGKDVAFKKNGLTANGVFDQFGTFQAAIV